MLGMHICALHVSSPPAFGRRRHAKKKKTRKRAQFPPKGAPSIPARGTPLIPGPTAAGWRGPGSCDVGRKCLSRAGLFLAVMEGRRCQHPWGTIRTRRS